MKRPTMTSDRTYVRTTFTQLEHHRGGVRIRELFPHSSFACDDVKLIETRRDDEQSPHCPLRDSLFDSLSDSLYVPTFIAPIVVALRRYALRVSSSPPYNLPFPSHETGMSESLDKRNNNIR